MLSLSHGVGSAENDFISNTKYWYTVIKTALGGFIYIMRLCTVDIGQ